MGLIAVVCGVKRWLVAVARVTVVASACQGTLHTACPYINATDRGSLHQQFIDEEKPDIRALVKIIKTHMEHTGVVGVTLAAERVWLLGIPEVGALKGIWMQNRLYIRLGCHFCSAALHMTIQGVWVREKGSCHMDRVRRVRSSRNY
jgi:hypothetical protein